VKKHITVITMNDSHLDVRGEVLFDPVEKTLIVQGDNGTYMAFNWNQVEFFIVQNCDECEAEDD